MPRPRAITNVGGGTPKTAPEAPKLRLSGESSSAPNEPANSETK